MDDGRIIDLFWQRSEQAIDAVDGKYGAMCRGIAMNLLRSTEDAEECVNDAYHGLWNTIPPMRPEKLPSYIAKITRNLAMKRLTYRNAAKRAVVTVSFEELSGCIPDGKSMEAFLEGKDLSRIIDSFLDTLDEDSRNIFLRRYWFFDSIARIAQGFGMSQGAVKNRLYRTRKLLKDYLAKEADIYVG